MTVKKNDVEALKQGLAKFGPASIAIDVGRKTLKFYKSGVYDDPECSKGNSINIFYLIKYRKTPMTVAWSFLVRGTAWRG